VSERCPITTKPRDRARRRGYDRGWFVARSVGKKEKNARLTITILWVSLRRGTHTGEYSGSGGHVGCGIMFSSTSVYFLVFGCLDLFRDGLESLYSCCFDLAWPAQSSHTPSNRRRNGYFQTSSFNPTAFVALFSPVGLPRAPSHIDEWPFIITSSLERLALYALCDDPPYPDLSSLQSDLTTNFPDASTFRRCPAPYLPHTANQLTPATKRK
jgi:hypothetical protein